MDKRFAAVPVPVSETVCGLPPALSENESVPLRVFTAFGAKVTDAVQLAPAASVLGLTGHVDVEVKSELLLATLVIVRDVD